MSEWVIVEFNVTTGLFHPFVEALIFRDHGIADGIAEKPIWNGIPDFLPKHS